MIRRLNLDGSMGIAAGLQQTGGGLSGAFKLTGDDATPSERSRRHAPRGRIVHELQMLRPRGAYRAQHICRRSATVRGTPSRADFVASRRTITIACDNPAHAKPRSDAESDADVHGQDKARVLRARKARRPDGASRLATEDVGAKKSEEIRRNQTSHQLDIDGHTDRRFLSSFLHRSSPSRPSGGTIGPSGQQPGMRQYDGRP